MKSENKYKNKLENEKGITLIALVITIIILIIITAILTIATYQTGIIQRTEQGREAYTKSVEDENRKINEMENMLIAKIQEAEEPTSPQDGLEEKFKDNTKVPYVINYPVDIDGDTKTEDYWQVFYIKDYKGEDNAQGANQPDEGRRVFLIAPDYVKISDDPKSAIRKSMKKTHLVQSSAENKKDYVLSWANFEEAVCNLILPDQKGEANIFPKLFEESEYGIWNHQDLPGSISAANMLCTKYWSDFVDDTYADYAIGGPTYQMWINSWNMRHPDKKAYCETNELGYLQGLVGQNTNSTILAQETDQLYFPHEFDDDSCKGYWGASPCGLYGGWNLMMVNHQLGLSDHFGGDDYFGVRPIVCLKANVKLTKVENITGNENAEYFKIEF